MKMRSKVLSIVGTIGCIVMSHNITNFNQCISVRDASCNCYVDKALVLDYTNIIGDVSDETVSEYVDIVKTQVPQEAFNYLVNSGGRINLLEGDDVSDYGEEEAVAYSPDSWSAAGDTSCKYTSLFGTEVVTSTEIFIAADKVDCTLHEFMHVLDCCQGYLSQSAGFQQIYQNIDEYQVFDVKMQDYSLDYTSQDYYYLGSEYECFAEIMARYVQGDISDEGLQRYCKAVIKGI